MKIRFNKKLFYYSSALVASAAFVTAAGVNYFLNAPKLTKNEQYNGSSNSLKESSIIDYKNNLSLSDFKLHSNPEQIDISNYFAGEFVNSLEPLIRNLIPFDQVSSYWNSQFIEKNIGISGIKNKKFILKTDNLTPLNFFLPNYDIVTNSFANDIDGKLLIEVKLIRKSDNPQKEVTFSNVYELSGFKKVSENKYLNSSTLEKISFIPPKDISTYQNFIEKFNSLENDQQLLQEFVSSSFAFTLTKDPLKTHNNNVDVDFKNVELKFKDNKFYLNYQLMSKVYSATKDNLRSTTNVNLYKDADNKPKVFEAEIDIEAYYTALNEFNQLEFSTKKDKNEILIPTDPKQATAWANEYLEITSPQKEEFLNNYHLVYDEININKEKDQVTLSINIIPHNLNQLFKWVIKKEVIFKYSDFLNYIKDKEKENAHNEQNPGINEDNSDDSNLNEPTNESTQNEKQSSDNPEQPQNSNQP
ncbi:hypothetical protein V2E24_02315 [Mycoplasmopsis ciconiae]|uniref:Uncharacterized protein n=1 Tax=Mycoplasmopsis ciconiae TaxID=561067 RepID=A0ABU7MMA1_9BACT|nr:hypothetical protein [Mycoplasmopsis ciconiae]